MSGLWRHAWPHRPSVEVRADQLRTQKRRVTVTLELLIVLFRRPHDVRQRAPLAAERAVRQLRLRLGRRVQRLLSGPFRRDRP